MSVARQERAEKPQMENRESAGWKAICFPEFWQYLPGTSGTESGKGVLLHFSSIKTKYGNYYTERQIIAFIVHYLLVISSQMVGQKGNYIHSLIKCY